MRVTESRERGVFITKEGRDEGIMGEEEEGGDEAVELSLCSTDE